MRFMRMTILRNYALASLMLPIVIPITSSLARAEPSGGSSVSLSLITPTPETKSFELETPIDYTATTTSTTSSSLPLQVRRITPPKPKSNTGEPNRSTGRDIWYSLAGCETGGKYDNPNTGNGYYGFFQFSATTWRSVGGNGRPSDSSYEVQKSFAIRLYERSGWGQWPVCARKLGLL